MKSIKKTKVFILINSIGKPTLITVIVLVVLLTIAGVIILTSSHTAAPHASSPTTNSGSASSSASGKTKPIFIIYYMWWDHSHWVSHLGPSYPVAQAPSPLPAILDGSGCGTVNNYAGNVETDISQGLSYDQSNYQTFVNDVSEAAATGVNGFTVNWVGDGSTSQTASTNTYDQRLAYMFQAVHAYNNATGSNFKLMFNYQSSAKTLTMSQFSNDFNYLVNTYGNDPALDHTYSSKPEIIMAGTWKYTDTDIQTISQGFRTKMYLIGDEKPSTWDAARATFLDGTSYYWSSQDPYSNPSSFTTLQNFATTVRATQNPGGSSKTWLAPFTPGYNAMLLYNTPTCVPRNNGQTMHTIFDGNLVSNPDGWTLISWNEISEGSYIVPLTRYGNFYTNDLSNIIQTGR